MQNLRVSSLQWAAGVLCSLVGAVMLVIPYQFEFPGLSTGQNLLIAWGFGFLLCGVALLSLAVLDLEAWLVKAVHLVAGGFLLGVAVLVLRVGGWLSMVNYGTLALGLLLSIRLRGAWDRSLEQEQTPRPARADLLMLIIGSSLFLAGIGMLAAQGPEVRLPLYVFSRSFSLAMGLAFSLVGATLVVFQGILLAADRRPTSSPPAWLGAANRLIALLAAGLMLVFVARASIPGRLWAAGSYYLVIGLFLVLLPWLEGRPRRAEPTSLQNRLALVLALATAIPLVLTVALIGEQEDRSVDQEALFRLEDQAGALALGTAREIQLHQAALAALAEQPGLMQLPAGEQQGVLDRFNQAYPHLDASSLYGPSGELLASSGEPVKAGSLAADPIFGRVRRTGQADADLWAPPSGGEPLLRLATPVLDGQGRFAGMVESALPTRHLADYLLQGSHGPQAGFQAYLVDEVGQVIILPGLSGSLADLEAQPAPPAWPPALDRSLSQPARQPPVEALLSGAASPGSLIYRGRLEPVLAGYARLPGMDWGLIVQRPASGVEDGVHRGRNLAFAALLVFLLLTAAGGVLLAGRLTAPVQALARAAGGLSAGDDRIPLPRSAFPELERLTSAFGEMRRKLAARQVELEEQRALLQAVVSQAADGIIFSEPSGRLALANPAARRLMQVSEMEALRATPECWGEAFHPDGSPFYDEEWSIPRALRGETITGLEAHIVRRDGSVYDVLMSAAPVNKGDGTRLGAVGILSDITWRKQAEQELVERNRALDRARQDLERRVAERTAELEEANARLAASNSALQQSERRERSRAAELEALMDAVPATVWIAHDPQCQKVTGNQASYALLRMPAGANPSLTASADAAPTHFRVFHEGRELTPEELPLQQSAATGVEIHDFEERIVFDDGITRYVYGNVTPLLDEDGQPCGAIAAFTDISELVQARSSLAERNAALEASNRELRDFAFIASHDLQEPLRKIQTFGDRLLVLSAGELGQEGQEYVQRMRSAAARMQAMVHGLLDYSRISTHAQPFQQTDLNRILEEVLSDLEVLLETSGGRVEAGSLPAIQADPLQMRQMFQNLVANGLKFHRQGVSPVVKVYERKTTDDAVEYNDGRQAADDHLPPVVHRPSSVVELFFEDNGIGFEQAYAQQIFQPFQRLVGRSEFEGSGIGLAICRKIVERHGGEIQAFSQPGEGTRVIVRLPVKQ